MRNCAYCETVFVTGNNYPDSDVACRECATDSNNLVCASPEYSDIYWGKY